MCIHAEHTYEFVVEQQPIGADLFKQFCQKDANLAGCIKFLQDIEEFQILVDEKSPSSAHRIYEQFLKVESRRVVSITEDLVLDVESKLTSPCPRDIFNRCRE